MAVMNNGDPTFVRGGSRTHIDITCATKKTAKKFKSWNTLDVKVNTYHKYIVYELDNKDRQQQRNKRIIKQLDTKLLIQNMARDLKYTYKSVNEIATELVNITKKNTKTVTAETKNEAYWWNDEIGEKQREAIRSRRKKTRLRSRLPAEDPIVITATEEAAERKKELSKIIIRAKKWRGKKYVMTWNTIFRGKATK